MDRYMKLAGKCVANGSCTDRLFACCMPAARTRAGLSRTGAPPHIAYRVYKKVGRGGAGESGTMGGFEQRHGNGGTQPGHRGFRVIMPQVNTFTKTPTLQERSSTYVI